MNNIPKITLTSDTGRRITGVPVASNNTKGFLITKVSIIEKQSERVLFASSDNCFGLLLSTKAKAFDTAFTGWPFHKMDMDIKTVVRDMKKQLSPYVGLDNVTKKGSVVGWYLNRQNCEPDWIKNWVHIVPHLPESLKTPL